MLEEVKNYTLVSLDQEIDVTGDIILCKDVEISSRRMKTITFVGYLKKDTKYRRLFKSKCKFKLWLGYSNYHLIWIKKSLSSGTLIFDVERWNVKDE